MSGSPHWRLTGVLPTLGVGDLEQAVAYYQALGFAQAWSYPDDGAPTHAGVHAGAVELMLALCPPPERIERQNLYLVVDDLSAFRADVGPRLGAALPEVVDADYGMRDFTLKDPWGHLLTFGEAC